MEGWKSGRVDGMAMSKRGFKGGTAALAPSLMRLPSPLSLPPLALLFHTKESLPPLALLFLGAQLRVSSGVVQRSAEDNGFANWRSLSLRFSDATSSQGLSSAELVQLANTLTHAPCSPCQGGTAISRVLITSCRANGLSRTIDEGSACANILSAMADCTLIQGARRDS